MEKLVNIIQQDTIYIQDITEASLDVCEGADSFLQSSMWGEFKSRFGWTAKAFLIEWQKDNARQKLPLLTLLRRLAPGFSFVYVPWGPVLPQAFSSDDRVKALSELAAKLKPFFARNCAFLRFDPPWFTEENGGRQEIARNESEMLRAAGFKRAAVVQPPDTVIIDLLKTREEILSSMKPKWRYNISLAGKKSVNVNTSDVRDIEVFYNLLKETAQRDGIAVHGINYYKTLFEICGRRKADDLQLRLYTASHEGETLAAIVVLFRGKEAVYLYGASSNNKRNLMAPYALQWKAMTDAKESGCRYYDLFGIPPNDDPNHPMAGLYRFKTGFGGRIIHRPGSLDYAYNGFIYNLFNFAETFRKRLMNLKKKKNHT